MAGKAREAVDVFLLDTCAPFQEQSVDNEWNM